MTPFILNAREHVHKDVQYAAQALELNLDGIVEISQLDSKLGAGLRECYRSMLWFRIFGS